MVSNLVAHNWIVHALMFAFRCLLQSFSFGGILGIFPRGHFGGVFWFLLGGLCSGFHGGLVCVSTSSRLNPFRGLFQLCGDNGG